MSVQVRLPVPFQRVAQFGRVRGLGPRSWVFKSPHADHRAEQSQKTASRKVWIFSTAKTGRGARKTQWPNPITEPASPRVPSIKVSRGAQESQVTVR